MNNKNIKTIDEHNIDREANVLFAFDLDGSDYVCYRISRDDEQDNLFISKVIKDIDGTFNMVNIDDTAEKSRLNSIVMALVKGAVENPADKLSGDSVSLSDGKSIKFITVNFNKEQRIEVKKTYVTTVKKEVSRVSEKYYAVEVVLEQPIVVDDIFPTVTPVHEELKVVEPVTVVPTPVVVAAPTVETVTPVVTETIPVVEQPVVVETVVQSVPTEVVATSQVVAEPQVVIAPAPTVVEPINVVPAPVVSVPPVDAQVQPTPVVPTPVSVVPEPAPASVSVTEPQPLVFNASKETNLNAALGEVANTASIPAQDISAVREFGVEEPVVPVQNVQQPVVAPMSQPEVMSQPKKLSKKAGFVNSKFFMVVAIAFFLASCIFLGYEVFNYFQITK